MGTWPLPRLDHGQFLAALAPEKPGVVGWDVLFTEHSGVAPANPGGPPVLSDDDEGLVQGVGMIPKLITGAKSGDGVSAPLTDLQDFVADPAAPKCQAGISASFFRSAMRCCLFPSCAGELLWIRR